VNNLSQSTIESLERIENSVKNSPLNLYFWHLGGGFKLIAFALKSCNSFVFASSPLPFTTYCLNQASSIYATISFSLLVNLYLFFVFGASFCRWNTKGAPHRKLQQLSSSIFFLCNSSNPRAILGLWDGLRDCEKRERRR